ENLGNNSWYDTSGTATGCTATNNCLENTSADGVDILNLQSYVYWSGTEYAPGSYDAWYFGTDRGYQYNITKSLEYYAWAVRSGDVSAVPVPAAVWLFGSGLVGLIGVSRRKRRHLALR
ncbi:PEP-CTERM sorting domain-containing protein, partial [Oceanicoccus sp.]|uniref:PEP-CTERM sorting domain-containing protein n=1 Tax=Oceanicoccus sp. TaxID=2691044 RepID=UPI00261064E7